MVSFTYDLHLIRQQTNTGQYLAWSFVNGGPGICGICPAFAAKHNTLIIFDLYNYNLAVLMYKFDENILSPPLATFFYQEC